MVKKKKALNSQLYREMTCKLLSHKCFSDYKLTVNLEPESFFEGWLFKWTANLTSNDKNMIWREFLVCLILSRSKE